MRLFLPLELVRLPAADSALGRPLQITVRAANGAPFPLAVRLSASGGSLSDGGMRIGKGEEQGRPVSVTPSGEGPVTVRLEAAASALEQQRYGAGEGQREWEAADWRGRSSITHPDYLGLEIVPQARPLMLYGYPNAGLELGGAVELDLPSVFSHFVGEASYSVESSDPAVAAADVEGDALTVKAKAAGAATVTVTATGRDGRRMERRFKVTVEEPLGSRWGGWRSAVLQRPSAEGG